MADNKEYLIHQEDAGSIQISEDVLASIAGNAVQETEGVSALMSANVSDLMGGKKMTAKGVKVELDGENIVVTLSRGKPGDEEAPGDTLNVLWFPEGEESPFTLGDPMETLGEAIRLAGE